VTKTDLAVGIVEPPAPWLILLATVLLFVANSRLPMQPSTARFGSHPSKKSKTCPAEQSVTSLSATPVDRTGGFLKGHPAADRSTVVEPSCCGISRVVETRLLAGTRRPEYLNSFAPSSTHNDLPPPRA